VLVPWDTTRDLIRLRDEMNRLFDRSFNDFFPMVRGRFPSIDLYQTENEVVLKAELPGVEIGDIEITATDESVTIKGETKAEKKVDEDGYIHRERRYGKFYRTIPLPVKVKSNEATANMQNGVLEIRIPKKEQLKGSGVKIKINKLQ